MIKIRYRTCDTAITPRMVLYPGVALGTKRRLDFEYCILGALCRAGAFQRRLGLRTEPDELARRAEL